MRSQGPLIFCVPLQLDVILAIAPCRV